ncbi:MAG: serine protease [Chloroflexi bacterium]|nr:serine protease [Chloroflexota bacterium]
MRKNNLILVFFWLVAILACGRQAPATPTAVATATPRPTATPSRTPTPAPTATPTQTPTPAPLDPAEIFDRVSPSIVFIETPVWSGSGVLIEGGYILTNAHVVWPFDQVRVVFPDGTEHPEAPVVDWDLMVDLALVGPMETEAAPLALVDGEGLDTGSDVYLIGYPGEVEEFPEPTITRGLISRVRQWEAVGVTYFQTDATIAGGQSGGVLVSELGDVIGISGFAFTEARFGLVASAADLTARAEQLLAGEDADGLGARRLFSEPGRRRDVFFLDGSWDTQVYVIAGEEDADVEMSLVSDSNAAFQVIDIFGGWLTRGRANRSSFETTTFTLEGDTPYFLIIDQESGGLEEFTITGDRDLFRYEDKDDGNSLEIGSTISGTIDYPGDYDYYSVHLQAGEAINIKVDSVLIDPYVLVDYPLARSEDVLADDDSGGGMFDQAAEITYQAPRSSQYTIVVLDAYSQNVGGYVLTIGEPGEGAPTPAAPPPTPTPIPSSFGPMTVYEGDFFPFSMQHLVSWREQRDDCNALACFEGSVSTVLFLEVEFVEDDPSLEAYVEQRIEELADFYLGFELIEVQELVTEEGLEGRVIVFEARFGTTTYTGSQFVYVHEEESLAFLATYFVVESAYANLEPMMTYTFSTFAVTEE